MPRNVTRKLKKESVRTLAPTFPAGRGKNQPSGKIKVRNAHPVKSRKVGRPGQQLYAG